MMAYGKRMRRTTYLLKKVERLESEIESLWAKHYRLLNHLGLEEVTYPSKTKLEVVRTASKPGKGVDTE